MESFWRKETTLPRFEALDRDIHTDVAVIGGGLAGVLCAFRLQQAGIDTVLLEADRIGSGVTQYTTAKITAQHGLVYHRLADKVGLEAARLYAEANGEAVRRLRALCEENDCDLEAEDAYVYDRFERSALEREAALLRRFGLDVDMVDKVPLPFSVAGAVRMRGQAQFHPLRLMGALLPSLRVYEDTRATGIRDGAVLTSRGTVFAKKIIITTHFPFLRWQGLFFLKMHQSRSYVLALEGARVPYGMYVDAREGGLSFRQSGDVLLLGGGSHRTGKTGQGWEGLSAFAQKHYGESREVCRYATQDCMTLDEMPYIGPLGRRTTDVFVATGFGKWGMSASALAADMLCDMVRGRKNPYQRLLSPKRHMKALPLLGQVGTSALHLLCPTVPRCPHLGCALQYNRFEHTWDCPCHGSRFSEDGRRLAGPAPHSLHKKPRT